MVVAYPNGEDRHDAYLRTLHLGEFPYGCTLDIVRSIASELGREFRWLTKAQAYGIQHFALWL